MAKQIVNSQIDRMKALMNYGLQTESKKTYSTVEYQKVGADGKTYGILREGTKFYIKVAPNKANLVKEDFNYIGGFRNRKDNEYTSYANAQKQFDLKMRSLTEAYSNGKNIVIESWNPDKQQELTVEATDNMRKEILRERQIMQNAQLITEKKSQNMKNEFEPKVGAKEDGKTQETSEGVKVENCNSECCGNCAPKMNDKKKASQPFIVGESAEVLGFSRDHDDYMDKSHGTKIGKSAPFDNNIEKETDAVADADGGEEIPSQTGKVNEGKSMHDSDNQNVPTPGTGEIGDDAPFDAEKGRQIDEADEIDGEDPEMDDEPAVDDAEMPADGDEELPVEGEEDTELGAEDDLGTEEDLDEPVDDGAEEDFSDAELDDELAGDEDVDDDVYEEDIEDRLNNVEELLMQIADKLGITSDVDTEEYEGDDDLYGDDEDVDAEDMGDEEMPEEEPEYDLDMDDEEDELERFPESRSYKGARIFETRNYRRVMNEENRLNDFGKHPAYQKKVMTYPNPDMQEFQDYYDMNDDSVRGEKPYGLQIGDTAPFTISPEAIDNSIAESINRILGKSRKN